MTDTATQPIPRKLNDSTIEALTEAVTAGLPLERACHHIGINDSTWRRWRAIGDAELEAEPDGTDPDTRSLYARLCMAIQDARLRAERRAVLAIVQAAIGDEQTIERTTTRTRWVRQFNPALGEKGRWEYVEVTETDRTVEHRVVRDWRAALAWLERTQPETYARVTRQWISGPSGDGPVEISVEEMRSKVDAELQELAEKMAGLPMPGDLRERPPDT